MPIVINHKGNFSKTWRFLEKIKSKKFFDKLNKYGQMGVDALAAATPKRTGLTASSWTYEVHISGGMAEIVWSNTNVNNGYFYVAVGIQYGHGTRNGGYVAGIDYINPAMRPIFEQIANEVWLEVISDG